jgi:hypothetical protein
VEEVRHLTVDQIIVGGDVLSGPIASGVHRAAVGFIQASALPQRE